MLLSGYLAVGWVIRLVMIPVVARRHQANVAMAWLAPIFLFPVIGTLLYLWLGMYGLEREAKRHRHVRRVIETDDRLRDQQSHAVRRAAGPDHQDMIRLAEHLSTKQIGGFPILDGNDVDLLTGPGEAVNRLIRDIEMAERHVHLMFYIYIDDATGRRLAEALARAAERGVACRLLVDAWASRDMRKQLEPWMEERGIRVHPVLPMHLLRQPLSRIDVRNHRKIAVIDGRIAYTGSQNIHDPGHALDDGIWHQISARVKGPAALQLQMLFVEDWYFATDEVLQGGGIFPAPEDAGQVAVQTVPGGPSYPAHAIQHVFVQAISEAKQSLVLTTPYLDPDASTLLALRLAALRGVEVDVVMPEKSDRRVADLAGRAYFGPLLEASVRIHLHPSGILHAKTMTVDRAFSLVGTANFDRRSMFLNYEDVLLIYATECTEQLRAQQTEYLRQSRKVNPDAWSRRPEREKYLQHTAKLLSPVL